jgi:predicted anti-sigma-YlaC factor YlaD
MTRTRDTTVAAPVPTLRPVQAAAVLSVLVLLWQFLSAGRILVGEDAIGGHGAGAIALHVTTGLLLAATVLLGRRTRVWWPAALAAAVFVLTFVQAALGSSGSITTHVPLALVVTVGVVWLAAWSFRAP